MLDEFISRQINRSNRNVLALCAVGLLAVLIPAAMHGRYLVSLVSPYSIGVQQLQSGVPSNPYVGAFVRVPADNPLETDIEERAENSNQLTADFVALPFGDRYLIARIEPGRVPPVLTGQLIELPHDARQSLAQDAPGANPALQTQLYPYELDTLAQRNDDWQVILFGALMLALTGTFFFRSLFFLASPENHPALKALRRYGDPVALSAQLAQEIRVEGNREKYGEAQLLSNWLVQATAFKTDFVRLSEVAWAYPKTITHYTSFVKTGTTYYVVVFDRFGRRFEVGVPKQSSEVFLRSLQRKIPWAIYGFSEQMKQAWAKNRDQVLRSVDARKASLSAEAQKPVAPKPAGSLVRA
jgi:hypothetical protein